MVREIALPSAQSLWIEMLFEQQSLATGTGFLVDSAKGPLLITNRHNVTGRDQNTGQPLDTRNGGVPDRVVIRHNKQGQLGAWVEREELLYADDGEQRWKEHPALGDRADFVALPLTALDAVEIIPYVLDEPAKVRVTPGEVLSVVGFPFGLAVGGSFAIWATGFVATEPDLDYDDLPQFLIDCRTRRGQSGSAVIAHRIGSFNGIGGGLVAGSATQLFGIYSGRINKESDLGQVWKASAIHALVRSFEGHPPRGGTLQFRTGALGDATPFGWTPPWK